MDGPLLLDLREVSFIDSCGIAGLLGLYRRCQRDGCEFLIESCSRFLSQSYFRAAAQRLRAASAILARASAAILLRRSTSSSPVILR